MLKGWWKGEELVVDGDNLWRTKFQFLHLSKLRISGCPNLTTFPPCPKLETLDVCESSKRLQILVQTTGDEVVKLRNFDADNVGYLKTLPVGCIRSLDIEGDEEVERLYEFADDVFKTHASSLNELCFSDCQTLSRAFGIKGLEHLTALTSLTLWNIEQLGVEDDHDVPWKSFCHFLSRLCVIEMANMKALPEWITTLSSLQSLIIKNCPSLKSLPEEIHNLTSLQSLTIDNCNALKSLPKQMRNLNSLQTLKIGNCHDLIERCKEPN